MQKQYQVTMVCATGQYRPVSTIVTIEQSNDDNLLLNPKKKKEIIDKGIVRICQKRYWTSREVISAQIYQQIQCKFNTGCW